MAVRQDFPRTESFPALTGNPRRHLVPDGRGHRTGRTTPVRALPLTPKSWASRSRTPGSRRWSAVTRAPSARDAVMGSRVHSPVRCFLEEGGTVSPRAVASAVRPPEDPGDYGGRQGPSPLVGRLPRQRRRRCRVGRPLPFRHPLGRIGALVQGRRVRGRGTGPLRRNRNVVRMDRHALAAFLRSRRERLRPEDVGLPRGRGAVPRVCGGRRSLSSPTFRGSGDPLVRRTAASAPTARGERSAPASPPSTAPDPAPGAGSPRQEQVFDAGRSPFTGGGPRTQSAASASRMAFPVAVAS